MVQIGSNCQLMKPIKKFIATIRQMYFNWRINREIFHRIAPHLNQKADYGYPFQTDDELVRMQIGYNLEAGLSLRLIGRLAAKMPKYQGEAFEYIAYRDLCERMDMYLALAEQCGVPQETNAVPVAHPA